MSEESSLYGLPSLPDDALYHIASFLVGADLLTFAALAPSTSRIVNHPHLWRALLRRTYGLPTDKDGGSDTKQLKKLYFTRQQAWSNADQPLRMVELCARWDAVDLLRNLLGEKGHSALDLGLGLHCPEGGTPGSNMLCVVCRNGGGPVLVEMLVREFGADPNARSAVPIDPRLSTKMNSHTPLSFAAQADRGDTVERLIALGAHTGLDECLACLVSLAHGHPSGCSTVSILLDRLRAFLPNNGRSNDRADVWDKHAEDVLLLAIEELSASNTSDPGVLRLILHHAPASLMSRATVALDRAVRADNVSAATELLKGRVPVLKARGEWAPIHEAAMRSDLEMIRVLVHYGADASALTSYRGESDQNAHMVALAAHRTVDVVEFLRTLPSPAQQHAQRVFRAAVLCLVAVLAVFVVVEFL